MSDEPERVGEGFLKRWSRRKRAANDTPVATEPAAPPQQQAAEPGGAPAEIDPADLPDIESLDAESDYTAFMQDGVPEDLRRLALRKLWRSNPIFANLDGLNDYDLDYSKIGMVDEVVKTAYRIGRGFLGETEEAEDVETKTADGDVSAANPAVSEASAEPKGLEDLKDDEPQA